MKLLTGQEAAQYAGVHRHTIRRWRERGWLKAEHEAHNITLYSTDALDAAKLIANADPTKPGRKT